MRTLVIGGTVFLGRAVVDAALARGDDVTYFHRGRHGRGLYPDAHEVLGDRADGMPDGEFDAVIDTCGFDAKTVGAAARALADRAAHYTFVSSISVYRGWPESQIDEASAVVDAGDDYGAGKAAAERAAEAAMPGRVLHVRAGLIVGPHENIGRLPRWLRRMEQGGAVLAPGPADAGVQWIDARDLADWMLADGRAASGRRLQRGGAARLGDVERAADGVPRRGEPRRAPALGRRRAGRGGAGGAVGAAADLAGAAARASRTSTTSTPGARRRRDCGSGRWPRRSATRGAGCATAASSARWRDEVRGEALEAARERALLEELMS